MAQIPQEVVNDIRQRANIEDVIGNYIEVTHRGNSYLALCPFHDDRNPSLSISPEKKIFKCFSCGASGDVFRFVSRYENISYPQAIKKVASLIGYNYDFGETEVVNTFVETEAHKIMRETVIFCQHELNSQAGVAHKKYLADRKLTPEILEKYQIGYNPQGNVLTRFLKQKGYAEKDMVEANVSRLTENGLTDVFYDRITIPIHDKNGHPIAITARTINPNIDSKYINSTDTPLYHKSDVLFNWHRAIEACRREKYMILAEGPMDVIAFDRAGIQNVVCSLGTSCTLNQIKELKRVTKHLVLAFDGDEAGQNAIYKTGSLAQENGLRVTVINNQTDLDPDEIVDKYGAQSLRGMIEKPKTWMEFIFDYGRKRYDLSNYLSRKEFASKAMEEINKLTDSFDRENYIEQLSALTGFSSRILTETKPASAPQVKPETPQTPVIRHRGLDGVTLAERTILKQMLNSYQMCELYKQQLNYLRTPANNKLALYILDYYSSHDELVIADFMGYLEDEELRSLVYEIVEDALIVDRQDEKLFTDAARKIKESLIDDQIEEKKREMRNYTDPLVIGRIAEAISRLKKEKNALRKA